MKKIITTLLLITTLLIFASCGSNTRSWTIDQKESINAGMVYKDVVDIIDREPDYLWSYTDTLMEEVYASIRDEIPYAPKHKFDNYYWYDDSKQLVLVVTIMDDYVTDVTTSTYEHMETFFGISVTSE